MSCDRINGLGLVKTSALRILPGNAPLNRAFPAQVQWPALTPHSLLLLVNWIRSCYDGSMKQNLPQTIVLDLHR
jgi:hypothetical protein